MTSHNAEESENSPESPHLGEIKRMRKQCVPGAPPFFARAGDEAGVSGWTLQNPGVTREKWVGRSEPTPDTLHLGCSYHLHSSHHFFPLGMRLRMLKKKSNNKTQCLPICTNSGDLAVGLRTNWYVVKNRLFRTSVFGNNIIHQSSIG